MAPLPTVGRPWVKHSAWGYALASAVPFLVQHLLRGTKLHDDHINILTKFHKDWMKTVTSTVYTNKLFTINILTKFHKDWMKTATSIINILTKFHKDWMKIINILTKFHKDWMKTLTSTVYSNKLLTGAHTHTRTHNGRRTSHGHIS
ncbi:hypothetical protein DPMN_021937 [Dreissena polymorpha]|uniref:Uncharacterized protein n=1 Tax=Dreissena polymorpha TaxID=45954 RepID=A0A9D4NJE8_DREPO|nr:hypothetical protein DPMN_021937 [Dreissena polymorpha]